MRLFGKLSLILPAILILIIAAAVLQLRCSSTAASIRSTADRVEALQTDHLDQVFFRIGSFNAWLLPIGGTDVDKRLARMGPAIEKLAPDILCVQEVWSDSALNRLAHALSGTLPHIATAGGGLAILSRWPVREAHYSEFPACTAPNFIEWIARKGFLVVLIDTPAGPLRVVNTHLAFDRSDTREGHTAQLSLLVEALRELTDIPTVLCADLNIRSHEDGAPTAGYLSLLDTGFDDAALVDAAGKPAVRLGTRAGWPRRGRQARWDPDYILFHSGETDSLALTGFQQALDTEETALSDHNLLLADFGLERVAGSPARISRDSCDCQARQARDNHGTKSP